MTDQPSGPAPAPRGPPRLPDMPRDLGAYLLLLIALGAAWGLKDKDLVSRIIHDFLDLGLLVWGTRARSGGGGQ